MSKRPKKLSEVSAIEDLGNPPQHVLDAWARDCRDGCGLECGDHPCAGCCAGGICDASPCRCGEDRECPTCGPDCHCGEDDPSVGECPGCGGPCQTACR